MAYNRGNDSRFHPKERFLAGNLPGLIYDLHVRGNRDECSGWPFFGEQQRLRDRSFGMSVRRWHVDNNSGIALYEADWPENRISDRDCVWHYRCPDIDLRDPVEQFRPVLSRVGSVWLFWRLCAIFSICGRGSGKC